MSALFGNQEQFRVAYFERFKPLSLCPLLPKSRHKPVSYLGEIQNARLMFHVNQTAKVTGKATTTL